VYGLYVCRQQLLVVYGGLGSERLEPELQLRQPRQPEQQHQDEWQLCSGFSAVEPSHELRLDYFGTFYRILRLSQNQVYLDKLDQYAKHQLKLTHYARYVDDIVAVGEDGSELHDKYKKMAAFVDSELGLKLHPHKKEINRVEHGVNFVGYIIKPHCTYIRRSTIDSMYRNIRTSTGFESLRATTNSYLGMLRHDNAYRERRRLAVHLGIWGAWFNGTLTKLIKTGGASCTSSSLT
jgi:hypothetical protein